MSRAFFAEQAWLPGAEVPAERVRIEVDGGRIQTVAPRSDPLPDDVRLPGVTFPGFANGHSHAFHRALRGRTHGEGGSFWTWRERMYAVAERLTPDTYYELARAVYAEMVLAGMTAVGEFHYLHHGPGGAAYDDPNAMAHALIHAASDAGIRLTLLDTCYLQGGIGVALSGTQLRFGDGTVERWIERVEELRSKVGADAGTGTDVGTDVSAGVGETDVVVGAAVHSIRAVPQPAIRTAAMWARDADVPLHVHLSEQGRENEECLAAYRRTPTEALYDAGALGPATTAVHATHVRAGDIHLLGRTGTAVCACPTTEQDLADGIGPIPAIADAGSPICLGSDQHAVVDPFAEARLLEMHSRLASGRRGRFSPGSLVAALTHGHTALGRPSGGRIEPGCAADLVAVRTDSVRTAGSEPAQLVFAASAADVRTVVVGGRVVVDEGQHVLGDVAAQLARTISVIGS